MEFGEKLCELRKSKGLTQEELAKDLYVSRTAISKWESGRGYPSIDSIKEISKYFSVSIDELLSGEKIISIAEKENKSNIKNICDLLFGISDILYFMLMVLPIYSNPVGEHIYAVNLFIYLQKVSFNHMLFWVLFSVLMAAGIVKVTLSCLKIIKGQKALTVISVILGILTVLFLAMTREAYAISVSFLLVVIKGLLMLKYKQADK